MNIRISLILLVFVGLILSASEVRAQYFEFGSVSQKEFKADSLKKTGYPAKYLFETGEYFFGEELELNLEYHARLLILREEGKDFGVHKIRLNMAVGQSIRNINAGVHSLNSRGRTVMIPIGEESITTEELEDGMVEVTLRLPEVMPGKIIEYTYIKTLGHPGNIEDWIIQRDIPVDFNRLRFLEDDFFRFSIRQKGYNYLTESIRDRYVDFGVGNLYIWVSEDIPALGDPNLLYNRENYRSRLSFAAEKIEIPGALSEDLTRTWQDIHTELKEEYYFGGQLVENPAVRTVSSRVTEGAEDTLSVIRSVHDFLFNRLNWNGDRNVIADRSVARMLSGEAGNSAAINLLYVRMLRDNGITAFPVLISTRDHGYPDPLSIQTEQFNHIAVQIQMGGESFLTDATSALSSLYYPPLEVMNKEGLLYLDDSTNWIPLSLTEGSGVSIDVTAQLSPTGRLKAQMDLRLHGYESIRYSAQKDQNRMTPFEWVIGPGADLKIDSIAVIGSLSGSPATNLHTDTLDMDRGEVRADTLIFDPGIHFEELKDPFADTSRILPAEFPYPFSYTLNYMIELPDNYTIAELPEPVTLRLPSGKGKLIMLAQDLDDRISYLWQFEISEPFYDQTELPFLNEIYKPLRNDQKIFLIKK